MARSFAQPRGPVCEALRLQVNAGVPVAHSLGMSTVAEGIDTGLQADVMRALGCEKGQGYLYSRPVDEPALRPLAACRSGAGAGRAGPGSRGRCQSVSAGSPMQR